MMLYIEYRSRVHCLVSELWLGWEGGEGGERRNRDRPGVGVLGDQVRQLTGLNCTKLE